MSSITNNELLLLSKNDIPFVEAQVNIHQPTLSEISFIGEESFWSGCQFLNFSKAILESKDKTDLVDKPDFEIFMSIMCDSQQADYKNNAKMVLTLLFPTCEFEYNTTELVLLGTNGVSRINSANFDFFKEILVSMFGLEDMSSGGKYNPGDKRAAKIAEKLQKAKNRKSPKGNQKVAFLSRYASILAIGNHKDINDLMQYTVFQLKDEFKRYQMKQSFDMYVNAKVAGASDLDEVDNWMDDIHP